MNQPHTDKRRRICLLGSTGSIGTQTLDVIEHNPTLFEAHTLTAGTNDSLLIEQARHFMPDTVVIADESKLQHVREALSDLPIKVYGGEQALCEVVESDAVDMVIGAMVGFAGLRPAVNALRAGKPLALANKETLVVAGSIITALAAERQCPLLPIDSEHSAILQCLCGAADNRIEKILLTCSGGPFRTFSKEQIEKVTAADALKHPTWDMGAKITIDSASLMNKGFEVMEAKWLFGVPADRIQVLIHPQSIVHSAVQFCDGSVKAQLGVPDMRLPIQYAFSYPDRLHLSGDRLDLFRHPLEFFEPDLEKFRCLALAFEAISRGGNMPCIVNAANEVVNEAFRHDRCSFPQMAEIIEKTMQRATFDSHPSLETYFKTDAEARAIAAEML